MTTLFSILSAAAEEASRRRRRSRPVRPKNRRKPRHASGYDDFTPRAAIDYKGGTDQQTKNREIQLKAMESDGFKNYPAEWWHYDFQACPESRILDIEFSEIK